MKMCLLLLTASILESSRLIFIPTWSGWLWVFIEIFACHFYLGVIMLQVLFGLLMKTPKQGGDTLVHAALSPELDGKSGLYLENSKIRTPSGYSRNIENQVKMFKASCQLCGIQEFFWYFLWSNWDRFLYSKSWDNFSGPKLKHFCVISVVWLKQ